MLEKLQMYINGEWVDSHSTETIEVMNPSDDSVLGVITAGNSDDVDKAVAAAKAAFVDFSFSSKEERVQILENIIAEYEKRSEELAETISKEMGAPIWLSQVAQVASGLTHFKDTLNVLKSYDFEYEKDGYLVRKEPVGVVGMITPWNWPMNQMCTKVASGIAAGCTMVLKPSEITPFCGIILAEIIHNAGIPNGVFNLVNGRVPILLEIKYSKYIKKNLNMFTRVLEEKLESYKGPVALMSFNSDLITYIRKRNLFGRFPLGLTTSFPKIESISSKLKNDKIENEIVVCRELTKKFETIYRGTATTLLRDIPDTEYRGEVTLVINKSKKIKDIDIDSEDLAKKLIEYKVPKREIAKIISSVTKEKVNSVYDLIKNL